LVRTDNGEAKDTHFRNERLTTPDKVSTIVEMRESDSIVAALAALAQPHRLAAFRLLVQAGPAGLAAGALAEALEVPNSSLSFHLAQLTRAGLIVQRRHGRSLIYSADFAAMNRLVGFLTENCCGGADCSAAEEPLTLSPELVEGSKGASQRA
jgi:DNA-binding transcriptional ArsR family regulator